MATLPKTSDIYDSSKVVDIMRETLNPSHFKDPDILRFIGNFMVSRSYKDAALASGLTVSDGRNLYNRADIQRCIGLLTESQVVKFGYDAEEIIARTKEIAFFDPIDLVNPDGSFIESLYDVPPNARRAIKKLKVKNIYGEDINGMPIVKGKVMEYEFLDKWKPLQALGNEKEVLKRTSVVQHDVGKNAREYLLASVKRADAAVEAIDITPTAELNEPQVKHPTGFTIPKRGGG